MKNLLLSLIAILFFSIPAQCQWGTEVGENVQLTQGVGQKWNTLIEPGPDGSWFISYTVATGSNNNEIRLSRVDSTGIILWDNSIYDPSDNGNPKAVMISDRTDGIIMAWVDRRNPSVPLIYANRIDLDGNKLWGANDVQVGTSEGEQGCPKILSDGQNGAIIACHDVAPGNNEFSGIYAHHVSSAGAVMWETFLFPNGTTFDCSNYTVSTDGEGGLIAFTVYFHPLDQENQIRGMRLDENGVKVWTDETINLGVVLPIGMKFQGSQDGYTDPNIAFHPSAGVYLVYFHDPLNGDDPVQRGQLIDIDGNKQWVSDDVVLNAPSSLSPNVEMLTDLSGNLYFNYHSDTAWKLQKVLSNGTLPWTIDGVEYSSDQTGSPDKLDLTTCNDVMVLVDGINSIIHAIRIDGSGSMEYTPSLLPISLYDLDYSGRDPVIRINEHDRVIAVWADDPNSGDWDLKMHGFHKDGIFGNGTSVADLQHIDLKLSPNPISKTEFLVVETSDINSGDVSLINSTGKTVMEKGKIDFRNGATRISLSHELSAGIYFLQISHDNGLFSSKLAVY